MTKFIIWGLSQPDIFYNLNSSASTSGTHSTLSSDNIWKYCVDAMEVSDEQQKQLRALK